MSAIDRNSLVPFDRDLEYTIEGANDIRTGENAIIPSSMSNFFRLELLWCCSLFSTWETVNLRLEKKHRTVRQLKFICDLQALSQ